MKQKKYFIALFAVMLLAIPVMVESKRDVMERVQSQTNLNSAECEQARIKKGKAKPKVLEVSFDYQRQAGPGSNQYAVWIENEKGDVVKTLFVTSYTTKGRTRPGEEPMRGYVKRPNCVPTWVKKAKAAEQTDLQLDAVTGATPQAGGTQIFTWDFTDQQGKTVPQGTYKIVVEATLYQASDIIYCGSFSTRDKAGDIKLTSTLTEPDENHKDMVTNVKAVLK